MKLKLVQDWRAWWKWHSTWIALLLAALPVAWMNMPSDLKAFVPVEWMPYVSGVMFFAFLVGRLRDQGE